MYDTLYRWDEAENVLNQGIKNGAEPLIGLEYQLKQLHARKAALPEKPDNENGISNFDMECRVRESWFAICCTH